MRLPDLFIVIAIIVILILVAPIWIPLYGLYRFSETFSEFRFRRYLRTIDGTRYFLYISKRTSQSYIQDKIIPLLPSGTKVIQLTEKYQNMGDDEPFFVPIMFRVHAKKKGFPYLLRVSNGELIIQSINHELYRAISRGKEAAAAIRKIDRFFDSEYGVGKQD